MTKDKEEEKFEEIRLQIYKDKSNEGIKEYVKYLRRRVGSLQGWNGRLKVDNALLKKQKAALYIELERLKEANKTLVRLANKYAQTKQEKQEAIAALKEVEEKISNLKEAYDTYGQGKGNILSLGQRLSVLSAAIKELFDPTPDVIDVVVNKDPYEDKPWMKTDPASTNRSLRED